MKNNKKIALLGIAAVTGFGVVAGLAAKRSASFATECTHTSVNHYDPYAPTEKDLGKRQEYWICCGCSTAWADEAKTQVLEPGAIDLAKKTVGTKIDVSEVKSGVKDLYQGEDKLKGWDQTDWVAKPNGKGTGEVSYYNIDDKDALYLSATSLTDTQRTALAGSNSGYSECRFAHTSTNLESVTFSYKYYDLNETAKFNTENHVNIQWYNADYHTVGIELVNDNQWHTITINTAGTKCEEVNKYMTFKIQQFHGEIYLADLYFDDDEAKAAAIAADVADLVTSINNIATPVEAYQMDEVAALYAEYTALDEAHKAAVSNVSKLDAAYAETSQYEVVVDFGKPKSEANPNGINAYGTNDKVKTYNVKDETYGTHIEFISNGTAAGSNGSFAFNNLAAHVNGRKFSTAVMWVYTTIDFKHSSTATNTNLWNFAWDSSVTLDLKANQWNKVVFDAKATAGFFDGVNSTASFYRVGGYPEGTVFKMTNVYGTTTRNVGETLIYSIGNGHDAQVNTNRYIGRGGGKPANYGASAAGNVYKWTGLCSTDTTGYIAFAPQTSATAEPLTGYTLTEYPYTNYGTATKALIHIFVTYKAEIEMKTTGDHVVLVNRMTLKPGWNDIEFTDAGFKGITGQSGKNVGSSYLLYTYTQQGESDYMLTSGVFFK